MEISAINDWLGSECDYFIGCMLYERFGDNAYLKTLFAKGENAYTRVKLAEELSRIKPEERAQPVAIARKAIYPHEDFKLLPVDVQQLIDQAKKLHKENAARQNELYYYYEQGTVEDRDGNITFRKKGDQLKCAIIANTILDVADEVHALFVKIDYYNQHKVLPADITNTVKVTELETAYDVEKALQAARQYISKHKKNPLKADQVKVKLQLKDELERRKHELV